MQERSLESATPSGQTPKESQRTPYSRRDRQETNIRRKRFAPKDVQVRTARQRDRKRTRLRAFSHSTQAPRKKTPNQSAQRKTRFVDPPQQSAHLREVDLSQWAVVRCGFLYGERRKRALHQSAAQYCY